MMSELTETAPESGPKLFISYSWTSPDHEAWVLNLATELCASGIDVILDKWDLREGHDAHAFMEKMVSDPEIKKVILVCDKAYVDKTDGRSGGVGTEAQIISGEIYQKQAQDKFVAVTKERDENGKPYVPIYYRSRIYIDLSAPDIYSENFEKLLRWVYSQPVHQKPELGPKPSFLAEAQGGISLPTSSRLHRALEGVPNGRPYAISATAEYLALLSDQLEKFRIDPESNPFDEAVIQNIESFLPYRNEATNLINNVALHIDTQESRAMLHHFFEQIIPYTDIPENVGRYRNWDWDNYKFIVHELFLHTIALLIRHERFESAAHLLTGLYYVPRRIRFGDDPMVSFSVLSRHLESLEFRNQRLNLRRLSIHADLLQQRCKGVGIEFRHLMQADFILFIRSAVDAQGNLLPSWFPHTLAYIRDGQFELFVRSRSKEYFDRAKILLGISAKENLKPILEAFGASPQFFPRWGGFQSFNSEHLLGFENLASRP